MAVSLPHILVIDDQYGRDSSQWAMFCRRLGLWDASSAVLPGEAAALGEASLCSGQRREASWVVNDYDLVRSAVIEGGTARWAMVLLDATFVSGKVSNGIAGGRPDDETFGLETRAKLLREFPGLPIVMLTSKHQAELEDLTIPYLAKQGIDRRELQKQLLVNGILSPEQVRNVLELSSDQIAESPASIATFRQAFIHARSNSSLLIMGETGTGKEVLARYLHAQSRPTGPFVAVNAAAIPNELFEAELFGIEEKTATGVGKRIGKFEQAIGGTLFLDEIADLPSHCQPKILRVLQERELIRVGGRTEIELDIRLVCATNHDVGHLVATRRLREDLWHRINAVTITCAPLRERREDVAPLAARTLANAQREEGKAGIILSPAALKAIQSHSFTGNVRELEALVRRLTTAAGNNAVIDEPQVIRELRKPTHATPPHTSKAGEAFVQKAPEILRPTANEPASLEQLLEAFRKLQLSESSDLPAGAKPAIESAVQDVLRRLAGAALFRYRKPVTEAPNLQAAMRVLTGDAKLSGKGPARALNELLGRKQDTPVTPEDINALIAYWRQGAIPP